MKSSLEMKISTPGYVAISSVIPSSKSSDSLLLSSSSNTNSSFNALEKSPSRLAGATSFFSDLDYLSLKSILYMHRLSDGNS